jgi:hypothetical protein
MKTVNLSMPSAEEFCSDSEWSRIDTRKDFLAAAFYAANAPPA